MKLIMPFDTETTGLPLWKEPSESEGQPHLVQVAALLVDPVTRETKESIDVIIKPDGWTIPDEVAAIHGITTERAMDEGIAEAEALEMFLAMYRQCSLRIAHNTTFDNRLIRIALKRYQPDLISDEEWKDTSKYFCTLTAAKRIMGGKSGHTLAEAYKHFTGKDLEGAHNAMNDVNACLEIYWHM
jgi:DNA polymerase-3 subunit epsilon